MANVNFSLSALLGKHVTFSVPLDLELLSVSKHQYSGCKHQLQGVIGGFSVLEGSIEILIDDEYYNLSDVEILSLST